MSIVVMVLTAFLFDGQTEAQALTSKAPTTVAECEIAGARLAAMGMRANEGVVASIEVHCFEQKTDAKFVAR